jgi:probable phosphoglycerate mutase
LRRATETREILSGTPPRCDAALIEMDWGDWEGLRLSELRDRYGAEFARNEAAGLDFQPHRGESPRQVRERVVRWLAATALVHDSIVAVTHKGVLRAVLSAATGWDMTAKPPRKLEGGALHRIRSRAGGRIKALETNIALVAIGSETSSLHDLPVVGAKSRLCPFATGWAAPSCRILWPAARRARAADCRAPWSRNAHENSRSRKSGGAAAGGSGKRPGRSGT